MLALTQELVSDLRGIVAIGESHPNPMYQNRADRIKRAIAAAQKDAM